MRPDAGTILILSTLVAFGGPLILGLAGLVRRGDRAMSGPSPAWDWRLTGVSTLLHVLAFNLIFFVQEVFLVLPKALTPGLEPVLFHNNHDWTGDNPLAELFQGTGALATLIVGLAAFAALRLRPPASTTARLFLVWLAFHGVFMALPQVVVGTMLPPNDVGRAMTYLGFTTPAYWAATAGGLARMGVVGGGLAGPELGGASHPAAVVGRGSRTLFMLQAAVLPGLAGLPLIFAYRVPGGLDQVVLVPVVITVLGLAWLAGAAWTVSDVRARGGAVAWRWPLIACLAVLAIFQVVLRPGIAF